MRRASFQAVSPAGLVIDGVTAEADRLLIIARPISSEAACPECGRTSGQVHSRYERRLMDLPSHGRAVHLQVRVRRFRCGNAGCPRMIFAEPLAETVAPRAARRTSRLEGIVHHLGIALGGRPAASLARRLMLPVSRDTLLRVVRRRAASMRSIREVLNATVINPALLTCAERIQYDGFLLRQDNNRTIKALAAAAMSIKKITRQTGRSRKLVRSVLRGGDSDVFRCRSNILEQYLVRLGA